jgi:hypothetical protein
MRGTTGVAVRVTVTVTVTVRVTVAVTVAVAWRWRILLKKSCELLINVIQFLILQTE